MDEVGVERALRASADVMADGHDGVAPVDVLPGFDMQLREVARKEREEGSDGCRSGRVSGVAKHRLRRLPVDVAREAGEDGWDVTATERGVETLDGVDVLRHGFPPWGGSA